MSEIHSMESHDTPESPARRSFIQIGLGAVGLGYAGIIGYPIYQYLSTPAQKAAAAGNVTSTTLDGADKLPAKSVMMFKFGSEPAMLIHHADGSWVALGAVCSHLGCTVSFEADKNRIFCACHGGVYDPKTGETVSGPPPKGLKKFKVEVTDGRITVSKA